MNAKNPLHFLLVLSFAVTGAACSATTPPAQHPFLDARNERTADLDHASGRSTSAMDLRMAVVRR
jgi:hypothetical protein